MGILKKSLNNANTNTKKASIINLGKNKVDYGNYLAPLEINSLKKTDS